MQFPFTPKHTYMKQGGAVVEITGVEHKIDRPQMGYSRDYWYYLGRVKWNDTGKTDPEPRHI